TRDYFTEAAVARAKASRGDFTSSEDDNVLVLGIARDRNSLGYFGIAYYEANRDILRLIPVVNPKTGKEVLPTDKAIMTGDYHPLSRPLFIYINRKSLDKPYVKRFVDFYLRNAAKLIGEVGYVPLSEKAYELVKARVAALKTGAVLGGKSAVGVTIEELLR
ncbi:MAG TPA: protein sphX, partial [Nitrospiraceae bacterium]|nr:protein sphX [Nitrospiraceae bacterium]